LNESGEHPDTFWTTYRASWRNGGPKLARSPESISLAEVLALTEPDFALAECMRDADDCPLVGRCKLPNVYGNALKAFMQALKSQTLKDVLPAEPA
jgi:DNA-binding IscR family transcriptional regulator